MDKKMLFGLDYDGTYTGDPDFFDAFIMLCQAYGHDVVIVTSRPEKGDMAGELKEVIDDLVPVVFARERWKKDAALEAGYQVDIWIDDMPESIAKQFLLEPPVGGL
jgi:NADPH:quinone reductase-like Zn-dependent oxidoreductase